MAKSSDKAWKEYNDFKEKVRRTVFLDHLSPQVTVPVIETALGQFGNVLNVEFIPNYTIPCPIPQCALVEMETEHQAKAVTNDLSNYPFMMSGMPRPVRAQAATAEMFSDRPPHPDRKLQVLWDPSHPNLEVGVKMKQLCRRHTAETLELIKATLNEEEKLASQQEELVKSNHKKYETLDNLMQDGSVLRLARQYDLHLQMNEEA